MTGWWRGRWHRRAARLARRRTIEHGEWLLDLGMPTDRAVRIKHAFDIQNGGCGCVVTGRVGRWDG